MVRRSRRATLRLGGAVLAALAGCSALESDGRERAAARSSPTLTPVPVPTDSGGVEPAGRSETRPARTLPAGDHEVYVTNNDDVAHTVRLTVDGGERGRIRIRLALPPGQGRTALSLREGGYVIVVALADGPTADAAWFVDENEAFLITVTAAGGVAFSELVFE